MRCVLLMVYNFGYVGDMKKNAFWVRSKKVRLIELVRKEKKERIFHQKGRF